MSRLLNYIKTYIAVALIVSVAIVFFVTAYLVKSPDALNLTESLMITSASITADSSSDKCYIAELPFLSGVFDDNEIDPWRSSAILLENGKALHSAHSAHTDIRELGCGRYSHWKNHLYFSTSDNSDPRINGRIYQLQYPLAEQVRSTSYRLFLVLCVLGIIAVTLCGIWAIRLGLYEKHSIIALTIHSLLLLFPALGLLQSSAAHAVFWDQIPIDRTLIMPESPDANIHTDPPSFAYKFRYDAFSGDGMDCPTGSIVTLLEDGRPLVPHSMHDEIRHAGLGRYSHWNDSVIFASTDNSDVMTNGRVYEIRVPAFTSKLWKRGCLGVLAIALTFLGALLIIGGSWRLALNLVIISGTFLLIGLCTTSFVNTSIDPQDQPTLNALLVNLWLTFRSILGSTLYALSAIIVGRRILLVLKVDVRGYVLILSSVLGAAIFSMVFTVVALAQFAYPGVIIVLALVPLVVWFRDLGAVWWEVKQLFFQISTAGWAARIMCVSVLALLLYALLSCAVSESPNVDTYHLVVPDDILRNHGFKYNPFLYAAGLQFGWHMFCLPGFVIGGDHGYFYLSFLAYLGVLLVIFEFVKRNTETAPEFKGVFAASVASYVIAAFCRTTLPNNDVPLLLVELAALLLAIEPFGMQTIGRALLIGVVLGFLISIKITAGPGAILIMCMFLHSVPRGQRLRSFLLAAIAALPLSIVWPLNTFVNSGSPFPQHLMLLRFQGSPFPHFRESETILNKYFGVWLKANYFRFFTGVMIGYSFVLLGLLPGIAIGFRRHYKFVMLLLYYSLIRMVMLSLHGDIAMFHDRYHLVTYMILGILGALGWAICLETLFTRRVWQEYVLAIVFCAVTFPLLTLQLNQVSPDEDYKMIPYGDPSLCDQIIASLMELGKRNDGRTLPHAKMFAWINRNLPEDARIAGNLIYTYPAHRQYLQMCPVSEDQIDLGLPPEVILAKLRAANATYLHLTTYNHLPPWVWPACRRWEKNLYKVSSLPGVRLLACFEEQPRHGLDELYYLGK